jgi:hypothetical protein
MSLLEARLSIFADLYNCLESFGEAFDLDGAEGRQLDTIGEFAGIKRLLTFQSKYEPTLLTDEYYRVLIKAKIFLNHWNGTVEGIYTIWNNIFPDYKLDVVDNQDMTMRAVVSLVREGFHGELIQHGYITPKPMGVLVNYDALTSWRVDGMIWAGGCQASREARWRIGVRPSPDDITVPRSETPYVMGKIVCWYIKQSILN